MTPSVTQLANEHSTADNWALVIAPFTKTAGPICRPPVLPSLGVGPPLPHRLGDPEDQREPVTAEINDADGRAWQFSDKLANFRGDGPDAIRCTLLELVKVRHLPTYRVSTKQPGAVGTESEDRFEFVTFDTSCGATPEQLAGRLDNIPHQSGPLDIDFVQHDVAVGLGILPPGTSFTDAKSLYWSARNSVGELTLAVLELLAETGAVIKDPDASVLTWSTTA